MASPWGSWISCLSITSTIIRATYPPGQSGHISSGEKRPSGWPRRSRRRPGKELHVTIEAGTAAAPPELIQLLTPEGERVDNPDYPLGLGDDDIKDMYRDLVLVRR